MKKFFKNHADKLILVGLYFILGFISEHFWLDISDALQAICFILAFVLILIWGITRKKKIKRIFIISTGFLIMFSFVVFPASYAYLANKGSQDIEIDNDIVIQNKKELVKVLLRKLPDNYLLQKNVTKKFLTFSRTSNLLLHRAREKEQYNDTLILDSLILVNTPSVKPSVIKKTGYKFVGGRPNAGVSFYSKSGKELFSISIPPRQNFRTVKELLLYHYKELLESKATLDRRITKIENNHIWTFSSIRPYTLYDSDLVAYKSRRAIWVHYFHLVICNGLFLAFILSAGYDILKDEN